jgi:hypothetical protein
VGFTGLVGLVGFFVGFVGFVGLVGLGVGLGRGGPDDFKILGSGSVPGVS